MEPEGSLPPLQIPTSCPCSDTDRSSPWPPFHYLQSHLNIILQSTPWSSKWSLCLRFPHQNTYTTLLSPILATCSAHLILLDLITRIIMGEEYITLSSSLCRFFHSSVPSSFLGPNVLLSTVFSNTLSLHSSLNVSDHVSHSYKTTGKIIVQYVLIFIFLDSKLKAKILHRVIASIP